MRAADTERYVDECIGPRVVGGRYDYGYWGETCTVLAIDRNPAGWELWTITEANEDELRRNTSRTHCTPWDPSKDRVVSQPEAVPS